MPPEPRGFTLVHPAERWIEVVEDLESRGHRVVLTCSRGEAELVETVRRGASVDRSRHRAGSDDVMEVAQLVAGARWVLSVDTGVSHLATTFRRPALTLFRPLPLAWWGPPPGNAQYRTLWTGGLGDTYTSTVDGGLLEISARCVLGTTESMHSEGVLPP